MEEKVNKVLGLCLNIYQKNDDDATIKILSEDRIFFFLVKGFNKLENKNKSNISIGSFSEFEYFEKYKNGNQYLLKKATMICLFDYNNDLNRSIMERLLFSLQKLEEPDKDFFNTYFSFLREGESYYKNHLITYLLFLCLKTQGRSLITTKCIVCKSNQNLYCFNIKEGGMFCFKHRLKFSYSQLDIVKSFYYLGTKLNEYIKNTNEKNNSELLKLIWNFNRY